MNPFEEKRVRDIAQRNLEIQRTINGAMADIGRRYTTTKGKRFGAVMNKRLRRLHDDIVGTIDKSVQNQWMLANSMNNEFVDGYLEHVNVSEGLYKSFRTPNVAALNAFLDRTTKGINLSDRVWNMTNQMGDDIETLLGQGVLQGKSAVLVSRELKKFVKGKPIQYKGGLIKGSNLNFQALRLAATENNMAFRTSDYLQNSKFPWVTGVTVHLSEAHPREDICDHMQGDYPSGFYFMGWHPMCICFVTYKRIPPKEFGEYLVDGKLDRSNHIRKIPTKAHKYVQKNGKRFLGYKTTPYWLDSNFNNNLSLKSFVVPEALASTPSVLPVNVTPLTALGIKASKKPRI